MVIQGTLAFLIVWYELNLYLLMLGSVFAGFFGGFASVLAASFAYAADVSTPGRCRSVRMSVIESMLFAAGIVSEGGAGRLLQQLNCTFWPLIAIYIGTGVLIIAYTALYLPEPLSRHERRERASKHPKGIRNILRGLKLFFCPSDYIRWQLWTTLGVLAIIVGNLVGSKMITAIFLEGRPLEWGPAMIGYYSATTMVAHGVATVIILPILVLLSLPDVVIALIGVVFSCGMNLFTGFVQSGWEMFLGKSAKTLAVSVLPFCSWHSDWDGGCHCT